MKRVSLLTLAVLVAAAGMQAAPVYFTAQLSGLSEAPPNASPGRGWTIVTMDPVANTLRVQASFSGLLANVTMAHIHVNNGPGDANLGDTTGPVATPTPAFPGFPLGVMAGNYVGNFDTESAASYRAGFVTAAGSVGAAEMALFDALQDGRAYLNIHTSQFPGGEIRGFLQAVPEPGTVMLMAAGLGALVIARRRFV